MKARKFEVWVRSAPADAKGFVIALKPPVFRRNPEKIKAALSENLTKQPLLRNFLHPLNREELDVGHRHPLGLQQQIPQVLIAPAAVNQHTNVPVHRFHHSEAYLRAAVVHYTFEVF